jgi:hypothetical protein
MVTTSESGVEWYIESATEAKMNEVQDFWVYCPSEGKKHGLLDLMKNESGGLLLYCSKCYKPRKKKA